MVVKVRGYAYSYPYMPKYEGANTASTYYRHLNPIMNTTLIVESCPRQYYDQNETQQRRHVCIFPCYLDSESVIQVLYVKKGWCP